MTVTQASNCWITQWVVSLSVRTSPGQFVSDYNRTVKLIHYFPYVHRQDNSSVTQQNCKTDTLVRQDRERSCISEDGWMVFRKSIIISLLLHYQLVIHYLSRNLHPQWTRKSYTPTLKNGDQLRRTTFISQEPIKKKKKLTALSRKMCLISFMIQFPGIYPNVSVISFRGFLQRKATEMYQLASSCLQDLRFSQRLLWRVLSSGI
jgi:hypothetical protein